MADSGDLFPKVCADISDSNKSKNRSAFYYPVLKKCLENAQSDKSVEAFFTRIGVSRVGFYAVNEFTAYILRDKSIDNLSAVRVYDLHFEKYNGSYLGKSVFSAEQAVIDYKNKDIEKIVICNLIFADEIFKALSSKGICEEDILTIDTLVYGM